MSLLPSGDSGTQAPSTLGLCPLCHVTPRCLCSSAGDQQQGKGGWCKRTCFSSSAVWKSHSRLLLPFRQWYSTSPSGCQGSRLVWSWLGSGFLEAALHQSVGQGLIASEDARFLPTRPVGIHFLLPSSESDSFYPETRESSVWVSLYRNYPHPVLKQEQSFPILS